MISADLHTAQQHWAKSLVLLQGQMTQAAFDAYLKNSRVIAADNNHYTIAVNNTSVKDWLDNRLYATIQRTLAFETNRPEIEIVFSLEAAAAPLDLEFDQPELDWTGVSLDLLNFDSFERSGFFPQSNYVQQYWTAYLGAPAMQLISYIRSFYKIPRYVYDKKAGNYRLQVFQPLPLLTPWQAAQFPQPLQDEHEQYLINLGINLAAWRKITAKSLVPYLIRHISSQIFNN